MSSFEWVNCQNFSSKDKSQNKKLTEQETSVYPIIYKFLFGTFTNLHSTETSWAKNWIPKKNLLVVGIYYFLIQNR